MNIKGIRLPVIIAVVILVLAVLFGFQYVYHKFNVEQPLFKLYSQTKAVEKFNIDNKTDGTVVDINLKKTDDLQKTYQDLYQTTGNVLGKSTFQLKILDNRNAELESAYYNMQFIINEALIKGNFSEMKKVIDDNSKAINAQDKVFIDDKNIYLQVEKGNNYLYEIIPRANENGPLTDVRQIGGGQQNG